MRRFAPLSLLVLSVAAPGCGSGSSAGTAPRPETTRIQGSSIGGGSNTTITMTSNTSASVTSVAASLDRVWRLLPGVYDSLGIVLTTLDPAKHLIGNEGMKIRQKIKNVALSQYIDCGQAQIGPSADSYDVFLAVTTQVVMKSATETQIGTMVEASAKPVMFSQDYSRCSSKGTIETKVAAILNARLATAK
jgi:hypothetical protein